MTKWEMPNLTPDDAGMIHIDYLVVLAGETPTPGEAVDLPYDLGYGLSLERFDDDLVLEILELTLPSPYQENQMAEHWLEQRPYAHTLVNRNVTSAGWDTHSVIDTVVGLSRLLHPNVWWPQVAGKISVHPASGTRYILPYLAGQRIYAPRVSRNWLRQEQAEALKALIHLWVSKGLELPARVRHAQSCYEHACRQVYHEWRHMAVVVALEALVNTDRNRSSAQFHHRALRIAELVGMTVSNRTMRRIYAARSDLAHGGLTKVAPEVEDAKVDIHLTAEELLTRALLRVFYDDDFRDVFDNDASVDAFFGPLPVRICPACETQVNLVCPGCEALAAEA